MQRADDYYYDFHSLRYMRIGVEGQLRYEEVAFKFKNVADEDSVSSQAAINMVDRALNDAHAEITHDV